MVRKGLAKYSRIYEHERAPSTTHWHLPSTSTRIKPCAAAAAGFQHPLEGVQGGEQKWGALCWTRGDAVGRWGLEGQVFNRDF